MEKHNPGRFILALVSDRLAPELPIDPDRLRLWAAIREGGGRAMLATILREASERGEPYEDLALRLRALRRSGGGLFFVPIVGSPEERAANDG